MATTDLKLDEPGLLPRPGPVGRVVRLGFGTLCLWYVLILIQVTGNFLDDDGHMRTAIWNGIIIGLLLVSYVVNIGFSKAWGKWPAFISAGIFLFTAGVGYLTQHTVETNLFAKLIWVWELYVFSHLGFAFIVSSVIASPGCEMRAFHALYSRVTGIPTKEHCCPVGPLHSIDQWEARRV